MEREEKPLPKQNQDSHPLPCQYIAFVEYFWKTRYFDVPDLYLSHGNFELRTALKPGLQSAHCAREIDQASTSLHNGTKYRLGKEMGSTGVSGRDFTAAM